MKPAKFIDDWAEFSAAAGLKKLSFLAIYLESGVIK
jgi:hypothetical protein